MFIVLWPNATVYVLTSDSTVSGNVEAVEGKYCGSQIILSSFYSSTKGRGFVPARNGNLFTCDL